MRLTRGRYKDEREWKQGQTHLGFPLRTKGRQGHASDRYAEEIEED